MHCGTKFCKPKYIYLCLQMVPCDLLTIQQSVLGDSNFLAGNSWEGFPGRNMPGGNSLPGISWEIPRKFPSHRNSQEKGITMVWEFPKP